MITGIAVDPAVVANDSNMIPNYLEGGWSRWLPVSVPDLPDRIFKRCVMVHKGLSGKGEEEARSNMGPKKEVSKSRFSR
jgi:hypothetical protein